MAGPGNTKDRRHDDTTKVVTNGVATHGKHLASVLWHHEVLRNLDANKSGSPVVTVRGDDLSPAELIAVSQRKVQCRMTDDAVTLKKIDDSVDFLSGELEAGKPVYGISTGFGGSADTRTSHFVSLQKSLLQHHHVGVLLPTDIGRDDDNDSEAMASLNKHRLPRSIVRGAMLARCNSLMRGHSAVRRNVIDAVIKLLNLDFIPVLPLRGSISASGDLTPLSYIAGALEGNPGIYVDCKMEKGREILPSNLALQKAGITPATLGPKEGLGIMNGTTVSCAAVAISLHEANYLALLTQALTGMCTEALRGSADNYHPFIAETHPGHTEAAANILRYLHGSKLAGDHHSGSRTDGLYQDRYALRTAAQWIAPQLEDLTLAAQQLGVEMNSTTDNPLIDASARRVHHGGNFQATALTSSTEKTRLALQMFGKLIFAQASEVINPMLNGTLPPNLSFDDPSLSYAFKGADINMAAYMSELAYLANPVSSHVQPAEMNNQAVNSLALVSARYTMDAVELVSLMCALHLYTLCQALDLQVMYAVTMEQIRSKTRDAIEDLFGWMIMEANLLRAIDVAMEGIEKGMLAAKTKDLNSTGSAAANATIVPLMELVMGCTAATDGQDASKLLTTLNDWKPRCAEIVMTAIASSRVQFAAKTSTITPEYLSKGSKILYNFVRNQLKISLHKGLVEHATYDGPSPEGIFVPPEERQLIGTQVSKIYASLRSGAMHDAIVESLS